MCIKCRVFEYAEFTFKIFFKLNPFEKDPLVKFSISYEICIFKKFQRWWPRWIFFEGVDREKGFESEFCVFKYPIFDIHIIKFKDYSYVYLRVSTLCDTFFSGVWWKIFLKLDLALPNTPNHKKYLILIEYKDFIIFGIIISCGAHLWGLKSKVTMEQA